MRKILVFDTKISGHHLEYIHHIHEYTEKLEDTCVVFAIPEAFKEKRELFTWSENTQISFRFLSKEEIKQSGGYKGAFYNSQLLRKICKEIKPTEVILIMLMSFMPFLPFLLPKKYKISGIIYKIYLYEWNKENLLKKAFDGLKYFLFKSMPNFKRIFILNDAAAVRQLNQVWGTQKFTFLPDPYVPLDEEKVENIRGNLKIKSDSIVFAHIGAMAKRKGTLKIFQCIDKLPQKDLEKYTFIFAGKVNNDIKEKFYEELNRNKEKAQILVFDEFCSYEFIGSLCLTADYLLLPYSDTSQSSGVIAYGSQFETPVIVPDKGLLGKIVRKYHLGYALKGDFVDSFVSQTETFNKVAYQSSQNYIQTHKVEDFTKYLLAK